MPGILCTIWARLFNKIGTDYFRWFSEVCMGRVRGPGDLLPREAGVGSAAEKKGTGGQVESGTCSLIHIIQHTTPTLIPWHLALVPS